MAEVDFDAIYRELDAIRAEAYAENDPDKLAEVSGEKQAIADLQRRVDAGETTTKSDDYTYTIDEVAVFHVADEDTVELRVIDSSTGETIQTDAEGNEIDRWSRETPLKVFIVLLERTGIDDWEIQLDLSVPNEFPSSSDAFVEQNTSEVGDQVVSFKTADAGDSQCYSLTLESDPLTPFCGSDDEVDNILQTGYAVVGDNEFEAAVGRTLRESDEFFLGVDGESIEFFGDRNSYAIKVAEFGTMQQFFAGSDFANGTTDVAAARDEVIQRQEGTFVPEESETEAAPPAEEPAPKPPAEPAPATPAEPAPGVNEPGGPSIEIGPDGEIIVGVGG